MVKKKVDKKLLIIISGSIILAAVLGYILPIPLWLALLIPGLVILVIIIVQMFKGS